LYRKPRASLPIPHLRKSAFILSNASNRLVVGQNNGFFCLLFLYRRDPVPFPVSQPSDLASSTALGNLKLSAHSGRSVGQNIKVSGLDVQDNV
jgi:hypothetical protein